MFQDMATSDCVSVVKICKLIEVVETLWRRNLLA